MSTLIGGHSSRSYMATRKQQKCRSQEKLPRLWVIFNEDGDAKHCQTGSLRLVKKKLHIAENSRKWATRNEQTRKMYKRRKKTNVHALRKAAGKSEHHNNLKKNVHCTTNKCMALQKQQKNGDQNAVLNVLHTSSIRPSESCTTQLQWAQQKAHTAAKTESRTKSAKMSEQGKAE